MLNSRRYFVLIMLLVFAIPACAWSPEAKKTRYLKRGNDYYSQEKYKEAVIEYKNVLRIDPKNIQAVEHLGYSYFALGEIEQAYRFLSKAKELDPKTLEVRLKLGTIYLLGRKPAEAHDEAQYVLDNDPKNLDALLLLAGSSGTPEQVDDAIQKLEDKQKDFSDLAKFHLALASLYLRKRDVLGAEKRI